MIYTPLDVQEQSSSRAVGDLKSQLQSREVLVADLQKTLQQRDLELDALRSKVGNIIMLGIHNYTSG